MQTLNQLFIYYYYFCYKNNFNVGSVLYKNWQGQSVTWVKMVRWISKVGWLENTVRVSKLSLVLGSIFPVSQLQTWIVYISPIQVNVKKSDNFRFCSVLFSFERAPFSYLTWPPDKRTRGGLWDYGKISSAVSYHIFIAMRNVLYG